MYIKNNLAVNSKDYLIMATIPLLSMELACIQLQVLVYYVKNWMFWKQEPNYSICELVITSFRLRNGYSREDPSAHWPVSCAEVDPSPLGRFLWESSSPNLFQEESHLSWVFPNIKYSRSQGRIENAAAVECSRVELFVLSLESRSI